MKWLQNSDLNTKEGSLDIFKAICNNSDSSEEFDGESLPISPHHSRLKCLQLVQHNIKLLEENLKTNETINNDQEYNENDNNEKFVLNGEGVCKEKNSYQLIKQSISLLREALNEVVNSAEQTAIGLEKSKFVLETQHTLTTDLESNMYNNDDDDDEKSDLSQPVTTRLSNLAEAERDAQMYKQQVAELNEKILKIESDANHTLEIMQEECEALKDKVAEFNKLMDEMRNEKQVLEEVINIQKANEQTNTKEVKENITTTTSTSSFEQQMQDEKLQELDAVALEREEELIAYKEQLEQTQIANIELRKEISTLKSKKDGLIGVGNHHTIQERLPTLLRYALPYGAIVLAITYYCISHYF